MSLARDIQSSESAGPTGPFLGKSGCVTVSPWIVTLDALAPARLPRQMAPHLPFVDYLSEPADDGPPCIDIRCSASLRPSGAGKAFRACGTEYRQTYWTHRQLVAHQTRNGSAVGTGDLLGTGTMSMFEVSFCCLPRHFSGGGLLTGTCRVTTSAAAVWRSGRTTGPRRWMWGMA